jgi:DNA-binding NarL/FixJ family response regulator
MRMLIGDCRLLIEERRAKGRSQGLASLSAFTERILSAFSASEPVPIRKSAIYKQQSEISNQLLSILDPLSEREVEILRLVASGLSNREIAKKL